MEVLSVVVVVVVAAKIPHLELKMLEFKFFVMPALFAKHFAISKRSMIKEIDRPSLQEESQQCIKGRPVHLSRRASHPAPTSDALQPRSAGLYSIQVGV